MTKASEAFKKVKKESVSTLKKKAWAIFSKYIRARDKQTCFTCGKEDRKEFGRFMQAGHYISRKHSATMFDERNVNAQCMNCNIWGYGNMGVYTLKLQEKYGAGIIKELTDKSKQTKQFTADELKELAGKYKQKLEALE